jgi:hypothetical protein
MKMRCNKKYDNKIQINNKYKENIQDYIRIINIVEIIT